jgi:hypothetical protein
MASCWLSATTGGRCEQLPPLQGRWPVPRVPAAEEGIQVTLTKAIFVRLFGAFIASYPGRMALMYHAFARPHRNLHDKDGSLYMGRWRVIDEDTIAGKVLEFFTGYSSARLHLIMRPDHDRELHNHPFDYRTYIVRGYYREKAQHGLYGASFIGQHGAGDSAIGRASKFHRISEVSEGGVLTLFFMTRNKGEWGFNVGSKFVNSTKYLLREGYSHQHVREVQTR